MTTSFNPKPSDTGTQCRSILKDRGLICLLLMTIIAIMGVASMAPILPKLARWFDVPNHAIGMVLIAYTLPGVVCTPLSGILADRIGRLQVLIPSLLIFGFCGTLGAMADSFEWFLAMRFCQGVGSAAIGLLNMTIISDLYDDPLRRTKALAYISAAVSLSTAGTPILAGILADISVEWVMLLPILAIPLALYIWRYVPLKSTPSNIEPLKTYLEETLTSVKHARIPTVMILTFGTFGLLFGGMNTFLPIWVDHHFQASSSVIGLVFAVAAGGTFLGTIWLSKNLAKLSPFYGLLLGFSFFASALFIIPSLSSLIWVLFPVFFWGAGQGINGPILNAMMIGYAPPENRGGLLAVQCTVIRLAQTIGPSACSAAYLLVGLNDVFTLSALLTCLLIGLIFLKMPRETIA